MINPYNDILVCNISTQTKAQYALAAGICSLAEKIPYNSISVIQLCRTAHIARSTFYVYYRNIDELLIEMEDQQILSLLEQNHEVYSATSSELTSAFYTTTLDYVQQHKQTFYTFLVSRPNGRFINKWKRAIKYHLAERHILLNKDCTKFDLTYDIAASMIIAGHTYLLRYPGDDNLKHLQKLIAKLWQAYA